MRLQNATNLYATSRYIVDPNTYGTPYKTIQSAIDAAYDAYIASGNIVTAEIEIRPGFYDENLIIREFVNLHGTDLNQVNITGTHILPTNGQVSFLDITFRSLANMPIFFSAVAGTTDIYFDHCDFTIDGEAYIIDIDAWTGAVDIENCNDASALAGGLSRIYNNRHGTSKLRIINSDLGSQSSVPMYAYQATIRGSRIDNTLSISEVLHLSNSTILALLVTNPAVNNVSIASSVIEYDCSFQNATAFTIDNCLIGNINIYDSTGYINNSTIQTPVGSVANSLIYGLTSNVRLSNCSIINQRLEIQGSADCSLTNVYYRHSTALTTSSTHSIQLKDCTIDVLLGDAIEGDGFIDIINVNFVTSQTIDPDITITNAGVNRVGTSVSGVGYTALAGNLDLPATTADGLQGTIKIDTQRFISSRGTNNTFIGPQSGNFTLNTAVSLSNTVIGAFAAYEITDAGYNFIGGAHGAENLKTGNYNLILGYSSGYDYTSNESSNILLSSRGVIGDQHVIRIGTDGTGNNEQDACYIAGIYTSAVGATNETVIIDDTGKLGSYPTPIPGAHTFITDLNSPVTDNAGTLSVLGVANELQTDGATPFTIAIGFVTNPIVQGLMTANGGFYADLGSNITIADGGNLELQDSSATNTNTITFGGQRFVSNMGTVNTFIGRLSGNPAMDFIQCSNNIGIGYASLNAITTAKFNVCIGTLSGQFLTSSPSNVFIGSSTGAAVVDGFGANVIVGSAAASALINGTRNTILGDLAGSNYSSNESYNIVINNDGTALDNNKIIIGTEYALGVGQDSCYIAGIYGRTAPSTPQTVIIDSNSKLGTAPIGGITWTREAGAAVAMTSFHGYINENVGLTIFTLPLTSNYGDVIEILGESAGLWKIVQNAGQNIQAAETSTSVGVLGEFQATKAHDSIRLICRVADTTWQVSGQTGGPFNLI